jgi:hydroxymethylpyrimidine/phosphomethylpyrimidine kinase
MHEQETHESDTSPAVLVIAGSDSSGGAGITRDLRTLTDLNINALCAITAVTAQTNTNVTGIHHVAAQVVQQQITTALATRRIDAIKIGMLGTAAIVAAVVACLADHPHLPVVLDPVLMSSSGSSLLDDGGIAILKTQLLPRITLLTPNLPEAAALLQTNVATHEAAMLEQAQQLLQRGPQAVLIKGGHASGDHALDVLLIRDQPPLWLYAPRINATMRGTGCALASAIAGSLALGMPIRAACEHGKHYVLKELSNVLKQGKDAAPCRSGFIPDI